MVDLGAGEKQIGGETEVGACYVEGNAAEGRGADYGIYLLPNFWREVEEPEGLERHGRSISM